MKLKDITDKIYALDDQEKMEEANELYYCAAKHLMECDPDEYKELVTKAESIYYDFDLEWAEAKVINMRPYGEHWNYETVKSVVNSKGITEHCKEYYLCFNMAFNDYGQLAEKYGQDEVEFCFDIAMKFINDEDAEPNKVAKYFYEM